MRTAAIIENGVIKNVIVIPDNVDGDKELKVRKAVEITNTDAAIGWLYDGESFIEPEPTAEELEARAEAKEKQANQESAKAKLTALGLDEAEVQSILGL